MSPFRFAPVLSVAALSVACSSNADGSLIFGVGPGGPSHNGNSGSSKGPDGQPDLGNLGTSGVGSGGANCGPTLTGLVRDFKAKEEPRGHPHFEAFSGN